MKHKQQHSVPVSYLRAWCDPSTPPDQTPYVWLFSRDGKQARRKAPERIFYVRDLYTIEGVNGERNLTLEHGLSQLEGKFAKLRRKKLSRRKKLTYEDKLIICAFTAAMHGRTKAYGEHTSEQWRRVLELGERMVEWAKMASPEQLKMASSMSGPKSKDAQSMTLDDVRQVVEHPLQSTLPVHVSAVTPMIFRMHLVIMETTEQPGFITSDTPCVWFDPAVYEDPQPFGAGGLISPTIEVTLPISPNQAVLFGNRLICDGLYLPITDRSLVDQINMRTRISAQEYFVVNCNKVRQCWFP